jgi:uncharacterized membrane protein YbhN (UPF0104 family)
VGAIGYVTGKIDFNQLRAVFASANLFWLLGAFILFNLSKILSSVRLNLYYHSLTITLNQMDNLRLYYIGMFYNLFLPGGISGDGYKIYLLNKHYHSGFKLLTAATLLDRISGLSALIVLAGILFTFSRFAFLNPFLLPLALIGAVSVIPAVYIMNRVLFKSFIELFKITTFYAFGVQLLQLLCALSIVFAIDMQGHMLDYLTLFLISSVISVLPISIGGIGLRELTFLYGFGLIGGDTTSAVSFSVLFFLITALSSSVGGFIKVPFSHSD